MIIEHTPAGQITHIVFDPVPTGLEDVLTANGVLFTSFPPVPLPDAPLTYESGDPVMETVQAPKKDDKGNVVLGPDGKPVMEDVSQQMVGCPGSTFAECDITTDYIKDGRITKRPTFDLPETLSLVADGVTVQTLTGLPEPCTVTLDGVDSVVTGGTLDLVADMPASYDLIFSQWPYIPHTIKVTADAPSSQ